MIFTQAEFDYLSTQRIGRLATVSPDGQVQNNPTNFFLDAGTGTIVIGGGALGRFQGVCPVFGVRREAL
jgi:pyridoxamine 5'-phosphate oxidase family protein